MRFFAVTGLSASTVVTTASGDTFITVHPGLGGSGSVHGADSYLYSVSDGASPGYDTDPLVFFDLSAYAGKTVTGNATLTLTDQDSVTGSFEFAAYEALNPWSESSVSWNSFGGFAPGVSVSATPTAVSTLSGGNGNLLTFTLSQALVQSWIDSPGANFGVLIHGTSNWTSSNGFSDRSFVSKEGGLSAPSLTFGTADAANAPEPASLVLVSAGIAAAALLRKRSL